MIIIHVLLCKSCERLAGGGKRLAAGARQSHGNVFSIDIVIGAVACRPNDSKGRHDKHRSRSMTSQDSKVVLIAPHRTYEGRFGFDGLLVGI